MNDELYHWGIKGMKWGVRRYQNKDGTRTPAGKNRYDRAAEASRRDAADLRKHGYTKEADAVQKVADRYQAKADAKRLKAGKKRRRDDDWSDDARNAKAIKKKSVKQMSNKELRDLNERTRLEQEYSRLNPNAVKKGVKVVSATAATMGTVMTLVNNSDKLVQLGKKAMDRVGNWVVSDLVIRR